jgi:hypothetical protein
LKEKKRAEDKAFERKGNHRRQRIAYSRKGKGRRQRKAFPEMATDSGDRMAYSSKRRKRDRECLIPWDSNGPKTENGFFR